MKKSIIKLLLIPFYALFLYLIIYFLGDAKDIWDSISRWVDKKFC